MFLNLVSIENCELIVSLNKLEFSHLNSITNETTRKFDCIKMKKILILNIILCHLLVVSVAVPSPPLGRQQQSIANDHSKAEAITAQSVNSDLAFAQNFMQLISQLFNNFNTLFPKFISLFTTTAPTALAPPNLRPPGQGLPSLPEISAAMPSMPNFNNWQPEKINSAPKDHTHVAIPRDVELIESADIETS